MPFAAVKKKGKPKEDVGSGFLEVGLGLMGDAHAGSKNQVSILLKERVDKLARQTGLSFPAGAFAENLLIAGIDQDFLTPGKILRVGRAILKIERMGKDPWQAHTYSYQGHSLLPRYGIFARVIQSGLVKNGDEIELLTSYP